MISTTAPKISDALIGFHILDITFRSVRGQDNVIVRKIGIVNRAV